MINRRILNEFKASNKPFFLMIYNTSQSRMVQVCKTIRLIDSYYSIYIDTIIETVAVLLCFIFVAPGKRRSQ